MMMRKTTTMMNTGKENSVQSINKTPQDTAAVYGRKYNETEREDG